MAGSVELPDGVSADPAALPLLVPEAGSSLRAGMDGYVVWAGLSGGDSRELTVEAIKRWAPSGCSLPAWPHMSQA